MGESGRKPRVQTRLPQEEADAVYEFADDRDLSQSAAVRKLIRAGLNQEGRYTRDDIRRDLDEIQADGGQLAADLETIRDDLRRQERGDAVQLTGIGLGLVFVVLAVFGYLGPETTVVFGVALIAAMLSGLYLRWSQ